MTKRIIYIVYVLLFICCHNKSNKKAPSDIRKVILSGDSVAIDSPANKLQARVSDTVILNDLVLKDTVVSVSIEGISAEGSETIVNYSQGIIKKSVWTIYGETGKRIITYIFDQNGIIKVKELLYRYNKALGDVRDENDRVLESSLQYSMDTTGVLKTTVELKDWVNVFDDFKANVPFKCLYSELRQTD